jgi:hypothetical protein
LYGLTLAHRYHFEALRFSKFLLQAPVVGFGMNLAEVVKAGSGLSLAALR